VGGKYATGNEAIELKATLLKGNEVTFNISVSVASGLTPEVSAWFNSGYLFISVFCDTQTYSDEIEVVITSSRHLFGGLTIADKFKVMTTDNAEGFSDVSPYQCTFKYYGSPENEPTTNFMASSSIGITKGGAGVNHIFPLCEA
jgi:hypothetical protein